MIEWIQLTKAYINIFTSTRHENNFVTLILRVQPEKWTDLLADYFLYALFLHTYAIQYPRCLAQFTGKFPIATTDSDLNRVNSRIDVVCTLLFPFLLNFPIQF